MPPEERRGCDQYRRQGLRVLVVAEMDARTLGMRAKPENLPTLRPTVRRLFGQMREAARVRNLKRLSHFPTMGPGGFGASVSIASTPQASAATPPTSRLSGQHDTLVSVH